MKFLICVFYLFLLTTQNSNAQTIFPKTNYSPGDCIINVSPNSSWFAKHARVNDIVYSKKYSKFLYILIFNDPDVSDMSFEIDYVNKTTQKVAPSRCKNADYAPKIF